MITFTPEDRFTISGVGDVLVGKLPTKDGQICHVRVGDVLSVDGVERAIIGIEKPLPHHPSDWGLVFAFL